MKFGVVVFPGSNCDRDIIHVLRHVLCCEVEELWHKRDDLGGLGPKDCVVLPGGFSYGDALRTGAIARFSPIMRAVIKHCENGGYALGICNGFQILCEAHLLPGVLLENANQQFICKNLYLRAADHDNPVTAGITEGKVLKIPIAHAEGRFYADPETLRHIIENRQILFRYCDADGNFSDNANPNGSLYQIAGICNADGNVFGMMPHPERASEEALGNTDGRIILTSLLTGLTAPVSV